MLRNTLTRPCACGRCPLCQATARVVEQNRGYQYRRLVRDGGPLESLHPDELRGRDWFGPRWTITSTLDPAARFGLTLDS